MPNIKTIVENTLPVVFLTYKQYSVTKHCNTTVLQKSIRTEKNNNKNKKPVP